METKTLNQKTQRDDSDCRKNVIAISLAQSTDPISTEFPNAYWAWGSQAPDCSLNNDLGSVVFSWCDSDLKLFGIGISKADGHYIFRDRKYFRLKNNGSITVGNGSDNPASKRGTPYSYYAILAKSEDDCPPVDRLPALWTDGISFDSPNCSESSALEAFTEEDDPPIIIVSSSGGEVEILIPKENAQVNPTFVAEGHIPGGADADHLWFLDDVFTGVIGPSVCITSGLQDGQHTLTLKHAAHPGHQNDSTPIIIDVSLMAGCRP